MRAENGGQHYTNDKKLETLVKSPRAKNAPPKNSESAAAQAKNVGAGNPRFVTPPINCSDGGSFPKPCETARATPAKIRKSAKPILAGVDKPDSPPKNICFSIENFSVFDDFDLR